MTPPVRDREQQIQRVLDITLQPLYEPGDGYVDSKRKEAERIVDALLGQPDKLDPGSVGMSDIEQSPVGTSGQPDPENETGQQ